MALGYNISYPDGWTPTGVDDALFIRHPTGTNVAVVAEAHEGVTLQELEPLLLDGFRSALSTVQDVSSAPWEGHEGFVITIEGTPEGVALKQTVYVTINGDFYLSLHTGVLQSLATQHDPLLRSIVASWDLFPGELIESGDEPGQAVLVEAGSATFGFIDHGEDVDYYRLDAVAGTTYVIETKLGTLEDSTLGLFATDAETLPGGER